LVLKNAVQHLPYFPALPALAGVDVKADKNDVSQEDESINFDN
jgi:hypothetical protein